MIESKELKEELPDVEKCVWKAYKMSVEGFLEIIEKSSTY